MQHQCSMENMGVRHCTERYHSRIDTVNVQGHFYLAHDVSQESTHFKGCLGNRVPFCLVSLEDRVEVVQ